MEENEIKQNATKKRKTEEDTKFSNLELPSIRQLLASVDSVYTPYPVDNVNPVIAPVVASVNLKIVNEPDTYQISNYNVQPVLAIELPHEMEEAVITAQLVADRPIEMGFQAASTQVISRNSRLVMFNGLKLNTMRFLKEEAKKRNISVRDSDYRISVHVNGLKVLTRPFKIVSSYSQLPKELQELRTSRQSN